ncbi:MAG: hypothetical protein LBC92_00280 [Rickettsiales bacterium]|jgi:hypothetical protein|nr:hypothetical protein [Rickettsiales bacterium]
MLEEGLLDGSQVAAGPRPRRPIMNVYNSYVSNNSIYNRGGVRPRIFIRGNSTVSNNIIFIKGKTRPVEIITEKSEVEYTHLSLGNGSKVELENSEVTSRSRSRLKVVVPPNSSLSIKNSDLRLPNEKRVVTKISVKPGQEAVITGGSNFVSGGREHCDYSLCSSEEEIDGGDYVLTSQRKKERSDIIIALSQEMQNDKGFFNCITKQIRNKINSGNMTPNDFIDNINAYMYANRSERNKKILLKLPENVGELIKLYVGDDDTQQRQMADAIVANYKNTFQSPTNTESVMIRSIENLGQKAFLRHT